MQVEALHDMPVAVPSLMEKFPLDLGIIVHVVQISAGGGGGGGGGGGVVLPYIHTTYIQSYFLFVRLYRYVPL